jgi:glycosidase
VDGFRVDTAVHIPRVTWNRRFLPAIQQRVTQDWGPVKGQNFFVFGEVAAFVNDKWNRGSVNHSAQFYTWKERKEYTADDTQAALDQYNYEEQLGTGNQPTSTNAFLNGNTYHAPDHSMFSGMNIIDMRMHMNFGDAHNAYNNGKDSDDSTNDATYNVVYVDSHDYGPNKSSVRYTGGTDAWAENMALMWTFRGIPTLYYGSEIEFQAGKTIDCGPSCPLATTGRAYYGDKIDGTVTASDFSVVSGASGAVATTLQQPLVKQVQRLNQIRRAIPALQMGQYSTDGVQGGGMSFKRRYTDTATGVDSFALVSVTDAATFTGIPNGTYKDAVTGDVEVVTNGTLAIAAPGKGNLRVYVLDLPGNPAPGKIGTDGPYLK